MVAYALECSVCGTILSPRKEDWLLHLLREEHQLQSRRIGNWTSVTEASLAVLSLSRVDSIEFLRFLSKVLNDNWTGDEWMLIGDFLWAKNRPRFGIVQFESTNMAGKIFARIQGHQVRFGEHIIEFRKASDLLQLEWHELLPLKIHCSLEGGHEVSLSLQNERVPRRPQRIVSENSSSSESSDSEEEVDSSEESKNSSHAAQNFDRRAEDLMVQFNELMKETELSQDECLRLENICRELRDALRRHGLSNWEVVMSRNCALRVRSFSNRDTPVLFLFNKDAESASLETTMTDDRESGLFACFQDILYETRFEVCSVSVLEAESGFVLKLLTKDKEGIKSEDGNYIEIISGDCFRLEAETFRLLNYLLSFDDRATPLLTLVLNWLRVNSCGLLNMVPLTQKEIFNLDLSEYNITTTALLVMFFLSNIGIIPRPSEVLKLPHPRNRLTKNLEVGFVCDERFRTEWKTERKEKSGFVLDPGTPGFVINVINLAARFFHFCGSLPLQASVLNGRKGTILTRRSIISKGGDVLPKGVTTPLRQALEKTKKTLEGHSAILLHPLSVTSIFTLSNPHVIGFVCLLMRRCGAKRFTEFATNYQNGGKPVDFLSAVKIEDGELDGFRQAKDGELERLRKMW